MPDNLPVELYEPSADERSTATLAHALQILGFLAPLIIWLIKRDSRFVTFHALQALCWQVLYLVGMFFFMALFMTTIFWSIATMPQPQRPSTDCSLQQPAPAPSPREIGPSSSVPAAPSSPCTNTPAGPQPFPKALLFAPLLWLSFMAMWLVTIVFSIVYAIRASHGEWANYPLLGRLVRSWLHLPRS